MQSHFAFCFFDVNFKVSLWTQMMMFDLNPKDNHASATVESAFGRHKCMIFTLVCQLGLKSQHLQVAGLTFLKETSIFLFSCAPNECSLSQYQDMNIPCVMKPVCCDRRFFSVYMPTSENVTLSHPHHPMQGFFGDKWCWPGTNDVLFLWYLGDLRRLHQLQVGQFWATETWMTQTNHLQAARAELCALVSVQDWMKKDLLCLYEFVWVKDNAPARNLSSLTVWVCWANIQICVVQSVLHKVGNVSWWRICIDENRIC